MHREVTLHIAELWHVPVEPGRIGRDDDALAAQADGAIAVAEGRIIDLGPVEVVRARHRGAREVDHRPCVLLPGFIDAHVHFPQLDLIARYGTRLLDWLERYTFPAEARFVDPAHAAAVADRFLTELHANGTTCAMVYATAHAASAEALFAAAAARGSRLVAGKISMDRDAPPALLQAPADDLYDSASLIARWHGAEGGRLRYALTPRFALTCSEELMRGLGALRQRHPGVLVQTHHAETTDEVAVAQAMFPDAPHYAGIYERCGLLGAGTVLGHVIHATDAEVALLARTGTAVAHCPTSNTFLGSGAMPLERLARAGIRLALGTDVGGGTSLSMLRTMHAAYDVQQVHGHALSPVYLLWLATQGGARALRAEGEFGGLTPGMQADFQVLDWRRNRLLSARWAAGEAAFDRLFATIVLGDDRLCARTYVAGREVWSAP